MARCLCSPPPPPPFPAMMVTILPKSSLSTYFYTAESWRPDTTLTYRTYYEAGPGLVPQLSLLLCVELATWLTLVHLSCASSTTYPNNQSGCRMSSGSFSIIVHSTSSCVLCCCVCCVCYSSRMNLARGDRFCLPTCVYLQQGRVLLSFVCFSALSYAFCGSCWLSFGGRPAQNRRIQCRRILNPNVIKAR